MIKFHVTVANNDGGGDDVAKEEPSNVFTAVQAGVSSNEKSQG